MSGADGRLNRVYPALTAKERALLVLRAWKKGEEEDRMVRLTMPDRQASEFNRYIDLMNGVNELRPYVLALGLLVDQLGLRFTLLRTLDLWAMHAWEMATYLLFDTKEPITQSEYERRVQAARAEMAPVGEMAEILVERHEGWGQGDFEEHADSIKPVVTDEAWERVKRDKRDKLARLVGEGVLEGRGKGKRLLVSAGSFYRWLGEEVPVWPEWGQDFEVMPDDRADEVEPQRQARERARAALSRAPSGSDLLLRPGGGRDAPTESTGDELVSILEGSLRVGVSARWQELVAAERVIDEVAAEFDGEDPALPDVRQGLKEARCRLKELVPEIQERVGPVDLEEGAEERIADLRAALGRLVGG
jgi:hypothetical protein